MTAKAKKVYESQRRWQQAMRENGWTSYFVFAPPTIINEIKALIRKRKLELGLYGAGGWKRRAERIEAENAN